MKSKLWYLTSVSLKRKIKTKWFLIVNIILAVAIIGIINIVFGLYVFFDGEIFNLASITMIGLCIIVQGVNIIHIGATIRVIKPKFIKTKEEMLEEAAAKFEEAHANAKEAIKAAKAAQAELKSVEETPEEILDPTLAPKPGTETESDENPPTNGE